MVRAVDTTFLVQLEIRESEGHEKAHDFLDGFLGQKENLLAVTPQVLEEFIHVSTDHRRFKMPLSMNEAVDKADLWWHAAEVSRLLPTADAFVLFLEWMRGLRLGRGRLHDTLLAATCLTAGIHEIVTSDHEGFAVFSGLSVIDPLSLG